MKTPNAFCFSILMVAVLGQLAAAQDAGPKIAVLGASLSKGLNLGEEVTRRGAGALLSALPEHRKNSIGLGDLMAKVVGSDATDHSDLYLFMSPTQRVQRQVQAAVQEQPDLIVGIDLIFWFGYWPEVTELSKDDADSELLQTYGAYDREIEKTLRSLEKQAVGLAMVDELLAKTKALIVVGDYPDMFGANPMMLAPKHIPLRRTLDELNHRLREFAAARPRVLVYPLADYVTRAKLGKVPLPDDSGRMVTSDCAIQADNLHPTRLGTALVLHELYGFLATQRAKDATRLLGPRPTFATLAEKAGAQKDLEALRAQAANEATVGK
jgi:hypothetical protein